MCALALVINAVNLAAAVAAVPTFGVRGSALCTAAVRCLLFLSLAALHRPLLVTQGVWPRAPGTPSQHAALLSAVLSVFRLYAASLLPATLRFGVAQLLTLLALRLGSSPVEAACIFLSALILDVGYSLCVGIQQANLKLTARYMSGQRAASARRAMRLAGLLLVLLAAAVGLACWMLRSTLGATPTRTPTRPRTRPRTRTPTPTPTPNPYPQPLPLPPIPLALAWPSCMKSSSLSTETSSAFWPRSCASTWGDMGRYGRDMGEIWGRSSAF